jgi:hypothetical protein
MVTGKVPDDYREAQISLRQQEEVRAAAYALEAVARRTGHEPTINTAVRAVTQAEKRCAALARQFDAASKRWRETG